MDKLLHLTSMVIASVTTFVVATSCFHYVKQESISMPTPTNTSVTSKMVSVSNETEMVDKSYTQTEKFVVTAYCPCQSCSGKWGYQTSTGVRAKQGRTIAVDPTVIPYGSKVIVNGHKYVAEDCGGAIKGNRLDIFFESHSDALEFGKQSIECLVIRNE